MHLVVAIKISIDMTFFRVELDGEITNRSGFLYNRANLGEFVSGRFIFQLNLVAQNYNLP